MLDGQSCRRKSLTGGPVTRQHHLVAVGGPDSPRHHHSRIRGPTGRRLHGDASEGHLA